MSDQPYCGAHDMLLTFSEILPCIKEGRSATRLSWNGEFVFLVDGSDIIVNRPPLMDTFFPGTPIKYHAHIDMYIPGGEIMVWCPNQGDILADDWHIFKRY